MLKTIKHFPSKHVKPRPVHIWLPPDYFNNNFHTYPVIYMHDGQNLFDPQTSFSGVDWAVDKVMCSLIQQNHVPQCIVVGIWNNVRRLSEYMPGRPVDQFLDDTKKRALYKEYGRPQAEAYLSFIVGELKPYIDNTFRTQPQAASTIIMGSSMGGLISLYALCEYPDVFHAAGCISTHWPAGNGVMIDYMARHLPRPDHHKVYFDFGTETTDRQYEPYQRLADMVMRRAGYREGHNWLTMKFDGDDHSEWAWRRRLHIPLRYLLHGLAVGDGRRF